jgi:hypothetical protein
MPVLTYTRAQILDDVERMIQDISNTRFKATHLARWADDAVNEIVTRTQCVKEVATANAVSGQQSYTLPADCIAGWAVSKVDFANLRLEQVPWDRIRDMRGVDKNLTAQGTPKYWSVFGRGIYLTKIPNTTDVMRIWYARIARAFTGSADTLSALGVPTSLGPAVEQAMVCRAMQMGGDMDKLQEALTLLDRLVPPYQAGKLLEPADEAARGSG